MLKVNNFWSNPLSSVRGFLHPSLRGFVFHKSEAIPSLIKNISTTGFLPILFITLLTLFSSCEKYFGDKTDLDFIDTPKYESKSIAYVPIQPVIEGFADPSDVIAGFDQLIYVVDKGSQEIISYDVSGRQLQRLTIPGVKSIAQDRSLDILALGTRDTTIGTTTYKLQTIYRINQRSEFGYGLKKATVTSVNVHPFYFKSSFTSADAEVKFNSISVLSDNQYYVTKSGPRNTTSQIGGPDDAVVLFNSKDKFITPISISSEIGTFSNFFKQPVGITTLAQPPQTYGVNDKKDFIISSVSPDNFLKVQYVSFKEDETGTSYEIKQLATGDTSKADGFLYTLNRFKNPVDVTYTGDGTNYIFVVDSQKDSVYQFTSTGLEGIKPPAGAAGTKNVKASFGGKGVALAQFNGPTAVAYLNEILYVVDSGNRRLLRFKLTTDFE